MWDYFGAAFTFSNVLIDTPINPMYRYFVLIELYLEHFRDYLKNSRSVGNLKPSPIPLAAKSRRVEGREEKIKYFICSGSFWGRGVCLCTILSECTFMYVSVSISFSHHFSSKNAKTLNSTILGNNVHLLHSNRDDFSRNNGS